YLQGDYEHVIAVLQQAAQLSPDSEFLHALFAASYAQLGQLDKAHASRDALLKIFWICNTSYYAVLYSQMKRKEDLQRLLDGLTRAGVPELPFGFIADPKDRVTGPALANLVAGKSWMGTGERSGWFFQQNMPDGQFALRGRASAMVGKIWID